MASDQADLPASSAGPSMWSILDNTLGIVSACLPLLPPLVARSSSHAWGRRSPNVSMNHSPSNSTSHAQNCHGPNRHQGGDMSSLAWGGANRSCGYNGGMWGPQTGPNRNPYDRPQTYRGLGGRQERARGPPLAFNARVFYPPGLRDNLSYSASSVRTPSIFSSLVPSRSISQRDATRQSRSASRVGSRGASRIGSRIGSRINSRMGSRVGSRRGSRSGSAIGHHSDEEEGHDLTGYIAAEGHTSYVAAEGHTEDGKTRVAVVSYGRRGSEATESDEVCDAKGITVTTTWDVDIESMRSVKDQDEEAVQDDEEDREMDGQPVQLVVDGVAGKALQ